MIATLTRSPGQRSSLNGSPCLKRRCTLLDAQHRAPNRTVRHHGFLARVDVCADCGGRRIGCAVQVPIGEPSTWCR